MKAKPGEIDLVIITAPSGAGKSTIVKYLLENFPLFEFSVSATSRHEREGEEHGRDYYFYSSEEFHNLIQTDAFYEWVEVYPGRFYGTLKSEINRIKTAGRIPIFDIDVKGALKLKKNFGTTCLTIFVQPPSFEELKIRLLKRKTENEGSLKMRLERAEMEMEYARHFDEILVNDKLLVALERVVSILRKYEVLATEEE